VEHLVKVERVPQLPTYRLTGDITITNTQRVPYSLAGIRLAYYTPGTDPRYQDPAGYIDVTCLGLPAIIVPPQFRANQPGSTKCSFDVPEPTGQGVRAVGGLIVQGKGFLSSTFDLFSDMVNVFDFGSEALTRSSVGGCATFGGSYVGNTSDYMAVGMQPSRILSGTMPKLVTGLLANPVCTSRNFTWVAQYGPANVNEDICGDYIVSVLANIMCEENTGVNATRCPRLSLASSCFYPRLCVDALQVLLGSPFG
jgi:hypothetical protein